MQLPSGFAETDYDLIFQSLPGLFLVISPQHTILALSNRFEQALGLPKKDLLNQPVSAICHHSYPEEEANALHQQWEQSLDYVRIHRQPHTMAEQCYTLNNLAGEQEQSYWQGINTPVLSATGEVAYIIHEARDITQEQLSTLRARRTEERFAAITQATNDAVWDWDLRNNTVIWNESYRTLFGFTQIDTDVSSWKNFIHPEDRERIFQSINQVIQSGGKFWSDEYRFQCADGSYSDILDRGYVLHDETGTAYRMVGSMQDITLHNKTEQQLKETSDFFQFLADTVPALIWTSEPDGTTNYRNAYYLNFVGRSLSSRPGFHWSELLPPEERNAVAADWQKNLEAGEYFEKELRIRNKDGEYRWVLARANPKRDAEGKIIKWLGTATDIHSQKMARLALIDSYQRFKFLADMVPVLIWTSNPDGTTDYRNHNYYRFIGDESAERPDFDWTQPLHPDDREETYTHWLASVRTGKPFEIEHRLWHYSGEYRWLLSRANPMHDQNGQIIKWFGTSADIHEQKLHQQDLQDREIWLQRTLTDAPVLFCVLRGPELVCTFMNPQMVQLYGNNSFIGLKAREAWPELAAQGFLEVMQTVYSTGQPFIANEYPINIPTRHEAPLTTSYFNISILPLRDGNQQMEGVLYFSVEVTGQVKAKNQAEALAEKLRHETEKFKLLSEAVPHLVWTAKPNGTIDYFNHQWAAYTGIAWPVSHQTDLLNVIHPDDSAWIKNIWLEALSSGNPMEFAYRFRSAAGTYRWHLTRALPMHNQQGQITMWVGTITDIHDQKIAQENLQEANSELKKINEDLDRFVYTASHDLKLPIINMSSLFEEIISSCEFKDPEHDKLVNLFYKSLDQINTTITDLAEIAKVQKNIHAEKEKISLPELTEEICLSIQDQIQSSGARITTDFAAVPHLEFSKANLRSILYNLISNAIKYRSPERVPEVLVKTSSTTDYVVLTVQDNGLGINLDLHKEKLFQMFKRFHSHVPGTGLGLYMINRIMQNNNGYVEVDSTLNQGSTFRIYFRKG
ncbi:hypothetical protein AAE02nite_02330 [Adhaeribacter aerolatus]|uniref:histidine kinase n=1 Tax=Adhaeribacter aerolatus TaxID=670289 RepID=A0A512AS85_9BACT|nr:PAS domain-containing protein [Adhaeribacter aerolatus]GEO02569.1 hypothetical protein AAE02nite_02330 [Adhaeribacter aerolatus]